MAQPLPATNIENPKNSNATRPSKIHDMELKTELTIVSRLPNHSIYPKFMPRCQELSAYFYQQLLRRWAIGLAGNPTAPVTIMTASHSRQQPLTQSNCQVVCIGAYSNNRIKIANCNLWPWRVISRFSGNALPIPPTGIGQRGELSAKKGQKPGGMLILHFPTPRSRHRGMKCLINPSTNITEPKI